MENKKIRECLSQFLTWSIKKAGQPISFIVAICVVLVWSVIGLLIGFSSKWILIIDTIATINASLMVFIIQNTQNRENKAVV